MKIESYSFGQMTIAGNIYRSDLIINGDEIQSNWQRKTGHLLVFEDLINHINSKIDTIIVGTGFWGFMKIGNDLIEYCNNHNISFKVSKTADAVQLYNDSKNKNNILAAFHLTC